MMCCVWIMHLHSLISQLRSSLLKQWWKDEGKIHTFSDGYLWRICDFLLSEAVPTVVPAGSSPSEAAAKEINASRTSSRGRLQGKIVLSGRYVGTSFIECTAISISRLSRASSISFVNRPFPPMSASGWLNILSPVVFIITIWIAPSSARWGWLAISLSRVSWAWARARGLSYIRKTHVWEPWNVTA